MITLLIYLVTGIVYFFIKVFTDDDTEIDEWLSLMLLWPIFTLLDIISFIIYISKKDYIKRLFRFFTNKIIVVLIKKIFT